MTTGIVFDIRRFAVHDGPGIRTTVFLKGCPLGCWWCHNPEGLEAEPEPVLRPERCLGCGACVAACGKGAVARDGGAPVTDRTRCVRCGACVESCPAAAREIAGRRMSVAELMAEAERDTPFHEESGGGVTFSGGEPLFQPDFLHDLLQACRARGIPTAVDTSGFAPWETLERIRGLVALFLYDLKLVDDARHRAYTGVSNEPILANLRELAHRGHRIVLRIPIIPGVNDDEESVRQAAALAAGLPGIERVALLPHHRLAADKYRRFGRAWRLEAAGVPSPERLAAIAQSLREHGLTVTTGA